MSTTPTIDLAGLDLGNLDLWREGPPHDLFETLRREAPLHWSELEDFSWESGFWSVVRFDDIAAVGRDHETFSSARSMAIEVAGESERVSSTFLNQYRSMPVRMG